MVVISRKQFLVLVFLWLVISYLLIWLFGGASPDVFRGGTPLSYDALSSALRPIPVIGWFLPFGPFDSVMYFVAPLAGFILAFILIRWFDDYFETDKSSPIALSASSIWFLVLMIVVLLGGYYINLNWYYNEAARFNSNSQVKVGLHVCIFQPDSKVCDEYVSKTNQELLAQAQNANLQTVVQYIKIDYWDKLRHSIFLLFILGAIAAWIPLFVKGILEATSSKDEKAHHSHSTHKNHEHSEKHEHVEHKATETNETPSQ